MRRPTAKRGEGIGVPEGREEGEAGFHTVEVIHRDRGLEGKRYRCPFLVVGLERMPFPDDLRAQLAPVLATRRQVLIVPQLR